MEHPKKDDASRARDRKGSRKDKRKVMPADAMASAEGGFTLSTSEILDFAEGTDSTP
jgi:hypothetical protein